MSNSTSRNLLIGEAVAIGLPISVLALLATGFFVNQTRRLIGFTFVEVQAILSVLSLAAIGSGWRLFFAYLRGGVENLRRQHSAWWAMTLMGLLILLAALVSSILPPSCEYSFWWNLRMSFNGFALAFPLLIPLAHLAYERFMRKNTMMSASEVGG